MKKRLRKGVQKSKKLRVQHKKKVQSKLPRKKKVVTRKSKKVVAKKSKEKRIVKKSRIARVAHKKVTNKNTNKKMGKYIEPVKAKHAVFGPANIKPYQIKQHEEYMNEKQREHFRTVLLQWQKQLMEEVDRTVHNMQDGIVNYPDPVDRASQEEEFSLELRTRDRERKLLRKIEETLNRISDNDYGYCDDCGAEIGIRRLEARPTATQCIECKTIAEIKEKQIGDGN